MADIARPGGPAKVPPRLGMARGGIIALAALMVGGIGHQPGPRRIGTPSLFTRRRSGRKRPNTWLAENARRMRQIAKGMLHVPSAEQMARWLDRRLAIAVHRAQMDPGVVHPKGTHTTKSARRRRVLEAARAERQAIRRKS